MLIIIIVGIIFGYLLMGSITGLGTFCLCEYISGRDEEHKFLATMATIFWWLAIPAWTLYFICQLFYKYITIPVDKLLNKLSSNIEEIKLSTDSKLEKLINEISKLEPSLKAEMNSIKERMR